MRFRDPASTARAVLKQCWQLLALMGLGFLTVQAQGVTPFEKYGPLATDGNRLVSTKTGKPVVLHGFSSHGLQWYGWGESLTPRTIEDMALRWNAEVLRLAIYPDSGGYRQQPGKILRDLDAIIEVASQYGLYLIIDWHVHDHGDPFIELPAAKHFFETFGQRHAGRENLLLEICNEPNGDHVTWELIRAYAAEMIPVVRQHFPDNIIIVGTPHWSSFGAAKNVPPEQMLEHPLPARLSRNVMVAFHFYAGAHGAYYRETLETVARHWPVFVTEWGAQNYDGDGENDFEEAQRWLALLERLGISWCYWNYSDNVKSGAIWQPEVMPNGELSSRKLKASGRFLLEVFGVKRNKIPE